MGLYEKFILNRKAPFLQNLTIYSKCDQMPLENYIQYIETQDLRWFCKEFENSPDLEKAMTDFYGDMLARTGNKQIIERFGKIHKIMKLKGKYNAVSLIIQDIENHLPEMGPENLVESIEQLRLWHYPIDKNKDLFTQTDKIKNRIKGLLTQAELLENYVEEDDNKEAVDLRQQVLEVGRVLELKYKIDTKETNMAEWITLQKQAKKQLEHEQRNRTRSKSKGT